MNLTDIQLSKSYADQLVVGMGAIKGSPCTIKKTQYDSNGNTVITFSWTDSNNIEHTENTTIKKGTQGEDGFSPTATVIQTSTGATISITDKNGTTTATVLNGSNSSESGGTGRTTVVANPILSGSEETATSIQIGDDKYVFPQTNTNGLTSAQITMLEQVLYSVAFTDASGKSKVDTLITSLRSGVTTPDTPTPEEPVAKTLTSISATKTTKSYNVGDTVSYSDVVVTATYSDSTTANVTSSATIGTVDATTSGTKTLNISYTENSITKSTTISITVNESSSPDSSPETPTNVYVYTDTITSDITSGSFNWGTGYKLNETTGAIEEDSEWAISPKFYIPDTGYLHLNKNLVNGAHYIIMYTTANAFKNNTVMASPYNSIHNTKGKDYYYRICARLSDTVSPTTFTREG